MLIAVWIFLGLGLVGIVISLVAWLVYAADDDIVGTFAVAGVICLIVCAILAGVRYEQQQDATRSEIAYALRQQGYELDASNIYEENGTWKAQVSRKNGTYCYGYVSIIVHDGKVVRVSDLEC